MPDFSHYCLYKTVRRGRLRQPRFRRFNYITHTPRLATGRPGNNSNASMSKFEEKVTAYEAALSKMDKDADMGLLRKVTKGLGPSIYNSDSNKVACSDKAELDRVSKNYAQKKLGASEEEADKAVQAVCAKYVERAKHRAVFYYLVCKELGKESVYDA